MKLRHYEYKVEEKLVRIERGTRFKPRKIVNQYRVVGSDNFTSEWNVDRNISLNILQQRGKAFNPGKYDIDFDLENGTVTIDEKPWPEPKISYRVRISAENNDIYYSVEELVSGHKKWKRIIHTPDQNEAIHKMMIMAEHNVLDEDNSDGLLIAGNYEIVIIGKDGYTYGGKDISEITGAHVVSR